jgi:hypothetical protein
MYKILKFDSSQTEKAEEEINEYAEDGYLLVNLVPHSNNGGSWFYIVMWKPIAYECAGEQAA